jgi:GAF domain-containing protein
MKLKEREALEESRKSQLLLSFANNLYNEDNVSDLNRKIMEHATILTGADKASIFLLDEQNQLLYSAIFDSSSGKRLSFSVQKGIAGYVARTGETIRLDDVYLDSRFNQEVRDCHLYTPLIKINSF